MFWLTCAEISWAVMQDIIEKIVETDATFSMLSLARLVWPIIEADELTAEISKGLSKQLGGNYSKLAYAILRHAFLIELVKVPKIETTKFRVRWCDQLVGDPRYCSFSECLAIAQHLITTLPDWLEVEGHSELLQLFFSHGILPYEVPIDYVDRDTGNRIHQVGNVDWFSDDLVLRTLYLRKYLLNPASSPDAAFFRAILVDKVKVKTYLTDRVLTGLHKTNREKRWETHPDSVHFALRRVCMAIEYVLLTQICAFDGFPSAFQKTLQDDGILPQNLPTAVCPITGDALSYTAIHKELRDPTHGKSDFQVGHLNPLKLGESGAAVGHTADNISWISADGNRIQGSLSLEVVRSLIRRISNNYDELNW
jgi:hypothetical protein